MIASLRDRLASRRLRVLVAGEAKRGKSTLVNALLGRPLLPTGMLPLTASATTVRHGRDDTVMATFADGRAEEYPVSALDDLVTEHGNPGNRLRLHTVAVLADAPLLTRGVELVDTPGTGSVHGHNMADHGLRSSLDPGNRRAPARQVPSITSPRLASRQTGSFTLRDRRSFPMARIPAVRDGGPITQMAVSIAPGLGDMRGRMPGPQGGSILPGGPHQRSGQGMTAMSRRAWRCGPKCRVQRPFGLFW